MNNEIVPLSMKFNTDLFINELSQSEGISEHKVLLSENVCELLKNAEALDDDVFNFLLLDFLTNCPLMKNKSNANCNFCILTKGLLHLFENDKSLLEVK